MSETLMTQDTNQPTSDHSHAQKSKKATTKPKELKVTTSLETKEDTREGIDIDELLKKTSFNSTESDQMLKWSILQTKFDSAVTFCIAQKKPVIEVDKEFLTYLNGGKEADVGYLYYKGIMVCEKGRAEDIAKKHNIDIDQVVFGDSKGFKLGSVKA